MREVKFKFEIDQKVKTPFGDDGIVAMLGFDDGGVQYGVKTAKDYQWYKEGQLLSAAD